MAEGNQEVSGLNRVIIEPTNYCNLDCSMCLQRTWSEIPGKMTAEVFSKFLADLSDLSPLPEIFFGGYGEPLSHPLILEMIRQTSNLGCRTSLITNGSTLTANLLLSLTESGLQKLWISTDSSHQEAWGQSRADKDQPSLIGALQDIRKNGNGALNQLDPGLALVLTKDNQAEILFLIEQGAQIGLNSFFITNLEAYSVDQSELLPYNPGQLRHPGSWRRAKADLIESLAQIQTNYPGLEIEGVLSQQQNRCPFAERGDLVLRWDGRISPCLPLLYGRKTYLGSWDHTQIPYSPGHLSDQTLAELWADQDFSQLRAHLLNDEFSPCLSCRDCWLSDDNQQDCMGFTHPTCGGCLWAAGLVNCP